MISTLKDAIREILENSPIPTRALAEELGISYSYLMNAGNPDQPDFKLPARLIIPLTRLTGNFAAVDYIEQSLGRTAFPLPKKSGDLKQIQAELLDTVNRFGRLVQDTTEALEDRRITRDEAAQLERDVHELVSAAVHFAKVVEESANHNRGYLDD